MRRITLRLATNAAPSQALVCMLNVPAPEPPMAILNGFGSSVEYSSPHSETCMYALFAFSASQSASPTAQVLARWMKMTSVPSFGDTQAHGAAGVADALFSGATWIDSEVRHSARVLEQGL